MDYFNKNMSGAMERPRNMWFSPLIIVRINFPGVCETNPETSNGEPRADQCASKKTRRRIWHLKPRRRTTVYENGVHKDRLPSQSSLADSAESLDGKQGPVDVWRQGCYAASRGMNYKNGHLAEYSHNGNA